MAGRKALISKDDLDRMACAVAAHGVVFKGRVDPMGGFTFTIAQAGEKAVPGNDDLDARLDEFASS